MMKRAQQTQRDYYDDYEEALPFRKTQRFNREVYDEVYDENEDYWQDTCTYAHDEELEEIDEHSKQNMSHQPTKRALYSARVDRFVTNGIIIVGMLLVLVLVIAFLV